MDYHYSAEPTKNPFKYMAAAWRLVRGDPTESTDDAAIVEIGFARSKLGRRFARWEQTIAHLQKDPRTAEALRERRPFGPIALDELAVLPEGSLGRVFADHCRARKLDPNLVHVPPDGEVGFLLNHMYQTHDIWHVLTGWGNDLAGEIGLGAFYAAQFGGPPFFGYMLSLVFMNVIYRRADLNEAFAAFSTGYQGGQQAQPLFGTDWDALWEVPVAELRVRFGLDRAEIVGEGIRAAA